MIRVAALAALLAISHPAGRAAGAEHFPASATGPTTRPTLAKLSPVDAEIRRQSARYLPAWDWTWLRAQLVAESNLDPSAVSHAGARGIAQLMPGTHREIAEALGSGAASPHDVEYSIEAAAYYMARMRAFWKTEGRTEADRRELAQASYNAGAGNIAKAQRECLRVAASPCRTWREIAPHLHKITGARNAAETLGYVDRIARIQSRTRFAP
jgi:membrane-bound lytic murein transglycosylase MltF